MGTDNSICKLLLVDNSNDDRLLLRRAVTKHSRFHIVGDVCDGEDAIALTGPHSGFKRRSAN